MPFRAWTTLAVLALSLNGCAPMTAKTSYQPPHASARNTSACAVQLTRVVDARSDPSVLGTVGGRTVRAPIDFDAWMKSILLGLKRSQIDVQFDESDAGDDVVMEAQVELKSAWVASVSTAKKANVVMGFTYRPGKVAAKTVVYRGAVSSVNWASGQGEIQAMIDEALSQVLDQAAADIKAGCNRNANS